MFDNPETPAPIAPAAPAAPSGNAPAPVPASAPADAVPAAFDVKAFEQSLKQFGPDWSLDNWSDKLRESRTTLGTQGRELGDFKRKYKELEDEVGPFKKAMAEDPNFRNYIGESVRTYFQGQASEPTNPGYSPQYAGQNPMYGFDPVVQRVSQLENEIRINRFTQELNEISTNGFPLSEDMANSVMAKAMEPGWERAGARDLYMMMYGQQAIQHREKLAAEAAASAIQKNNDTYTPGPARQSQTPPAPAVDFANMTPEQFDAYGRARARALLGNMAG